MTVRLCRERLGATASADSDRGRDHPNYGSRNRRLGGVHVREYRFRVPSRGIQDTADALLG
ncbi:hypothetical protein BN903_91 [Halorubrum sp. AJ67]|nr:hypothetical protein BN903_91 [Halorubrum sp. AJ67]